MPLPRLTTAAIFLAGVLVGRISVPRPPAAAEPRAPAPAAVAEPSQRQLRPALAVAPPPPPPPPPPATATAAGAEALAAHRRLLLLVYPLVDDAVPWSAVPFDRYQVILVTGPQRSGTTWVACALASSLGYSLYDERHPITGGNDTLRALQRTFAYLRAKGERAVIQSPMGTKDLHLLPAWPGLLVAFMARSCLDVFRSQNKVDRQQGGWTCSAGRTRELRKYLNRPDLRPHFDERDMICKVKQDVWRWLQAPELQRRAAAREFGALNLSATVDFDSFRSHPLWMRGEQRASLGVKSTNCELLRSTPGRTRWSTQQWMAAGDAALAAAASPEEEAKRDFSQTYQPRYSRGGRCTNCNFAAGRDADG